MPSKDGWTLDRQHEKVTLGRKQYRNMEEWSRPCCVCGDKFSIFTSMNAVNINSSFGLRTCEKHRGQKGTNANMGDEFAQVLRERDEAWAMNAELMQQNGELRRRLATYELPAAFAELQNKMPWEQNSA